MRLKKELDSVLVLQADLDASKCALQTAHTTIEKDSTTRGMLDVLDSMEHSHNWLLEKIKTLYASLNVQEQFPQLEGVPLEFVRTLLMAWDLKINIRKRAIGSFFEWDKLDWAVGRRDWALGAYSTLGLLVKSHRVLRNETAPTNSEGDSETATRPYVCHQKI